jgi:hypothetical protein
MQEKGDWSNLPERPATNLRSVPGFAQIVPVPFFLSKHTQQDNSMRLARNGEPAMLVAQVSTIELAVLLIVGVFLVVVFVILLQIFRLWFQAFMTGVRVSMYQIVGMTFRKVDPKVVVRTLIMPKHAGIDLSCNDV